MRDELYLIFIADIIKAVVVVEATDPFQSCWNAVDIVSCRNYEYPFIRVMSI